MARTMTSGVGGDTPANRQSWLPRTVAALFLGAGLYAGLAVAGQVVAHADETAASTTQAEPPATGSTPKSDTATSPEASPGTKTTTQNSVTSTSSTADSGSASPGTSATPPPAPAAGTTGSNAAKPTEPQSTTTTRTTTAGGTTTTVSTTTVTTKTTATATAEPTSAAGSPQATEAAVAAPRPEAQPAASVGPAGDSPCRTAGISVFRAGGSASRNQVSRTFVPVAPSPGASESTAGSTPAPVVTTTTVPGLASSDEGPTQPHSPFQLPTPPSAYALGNCGGPGADEGSPKGASAPSMAGVLGSYIDMPVAETDAAPQAPAAGSPTLSATDPATQPD